MILRTFAAILVAATILTENRLRVGFAAAALDRHVAEGLNPLYNSIVRAYLAAEASLVACRYAPHRCCDLVTGGGICEN